MSHLRRRCLGVARGVERQRGTIGEWEGVAVSGSSEVRSSRDSSAYVIVTSSASCGAARRDTSGRKTAVTFWDHVDDVSWTVSKWSLGAFVTAKGVATFWWCCYIVEEFLWPSTHFVEMICFFARVEVKMTSVPVTTVYFNTIKGSVPPSNGFPLYFS